MSQAEYPATDVPLLITRATCVPERVHDELERLQVSSVSLIGGDPTLHPAVASLTPAGSSRACSQVVSATNTPNPRNATPARRRIARSPQTARNSARPAKAGAERSAWAGAERSG